MLVIHASLFTTVLFTIFWGPLNPTPASQPAKWCMPFPLECVLQGPQTELRTHGQNCEQTLPKSRTNRIMNERAFLNGSHVYLNGVQQMVSGESAGECLQTGFERHGLPPQRAPLDTVYPLRDYLNSVQQTVSGGYCEGLFPDTVCWTRLRNTWGWEGCRVPTKILFEQEAPKIGTQKCSTKRRVREPLHVEFALNSRELVTAEVFERRVFEQRTPLK